MTVEIRYFINTTHTINGLNAYKLITTAGATPTTEVWSVGYQPHAHYNSDVIIRHSDSSETALGSAIAGSVRSPDGWGYQDGTWNCPQTDLVYTDAIKVVQRINVHDATVTKTFITERLNAYQLDAVTWTFTRYTLATLYGGILYASISGCYVTNFSYTPLVDIGIRIYDGAANVKIGAVTDLTGQKLRIVKGVTTYAIPLFDTSSLGASKIRIYDGATTKSLAKMS